MQEITTSYFANINVSLDLLWSILKDKIYHPYKYLPNVIPGANIKQLDETHFERVMTNSKFYDVHELITVEPEKYTVTFTLVEDDPQFSGSVINQIVFSSENKERIGLLIKLQWQRKDTAEIKIKSEEYLAEAIKQTVLNVKKVAEEQNLQLNTDVTANNIAQTTYNMK